MVTARFSLVGSMMLTRTAVATPTAAQTAPPVVASSADAQALGGLLPDVIDEVPKHLSVQTHASASFSVSPRPTRILGTGPCRSEAAVRNLSASSMVWQQSVPLRCRKSSMRTERLLPVTLPGSRCFTPSITTGISLMSPNSR